MSGSSGEIRRRLQFFPAVHQMADFPHQPLVPVDDRLRGGAIVVEAGRRHRLLDLANRRFAFGDLALEPVDFGLALLCRSLTFARFGVLTLLIGV